MHLRDTVKADFGKSITKFNIAAKYERTGSFLVRGNVTSVYRGWQYRQHSLTPFALNDYYSLVRYSVDRATRGDDPLRNAVSTGSEQQNGSGERN